MDVKKAIIPAAGIGSHFLPFTKAVPKEMIPLLEKPAIQLVVEEAMNAGIKEFFFITSKNKGAIADHFDPFPLLEEFLKEENREELLASLAKIMRNAHFTYIRQPEPHGLGHAVWMARHSIGKEYLAVLLPDDIISGKDPGLTQLMRIARQERASVIAVQEVPANCISSYGVVAVKKQLTPTLCQVSHLVEKPDQKDAPSNLAIVGRYVLSHKIFDSIEEISPYATGEIQLTDAISHMMKNNEKVFAYKIQGTRYDIGQPLGWIKAIIGLSLQNPHYRPHVKKFLDEINSPESFLFNQNKAIEHIL